MRNRCIRSDNSPSRLDHGDGWEPARRGLAWQGPAWWTAAGGGFVALLLACALGTAEAQFTNPHVGRELGSLKGIKPMLPDLTGIVQNQEKAIALGKALFWDQQAGSDGQACASCHFHAGADTRLTNQLNPGLKANDTAFGAIAPPSKVGRTASGASAGSNYTVVPKDFPFHQLVDPLDRNSAIVFDTNDVLSSQGTFAGGFVSVAPRNPQEGCGAADATLFHAGPYAARKVEPRQTPTTINAVFNVRNFWDGRANNVFNGANPFGLRDPSAQVLVATPHGVVPQPVALVDSSLASQAVGPPLSDFEMSCANKTFADLGRKLMTLMPLASQRVHANDSVLKPYRYPLGKGLSLSYARLIKMAFDPKYWSGTGTFGGYTQMERNFSFFWGIAIMLYESTLISDESPFDHFMGCPEPQCSPAIPPDFTALNSQQFFGLLVFSTNGQCSGCHSGPQFSGATRHVNDPEEQALLERMVMNDGGASLYDHGFYNIGVRPTDEDSGVGATDPFGNTLSLARQYMKMLKGQNVPDQFVVDPCIFDIPFSDDLFLGALCTTVPAPPEVDTTVRVAVDGAFKTPILRNVGLTPPYFHNGSRATLAQVVQFYNRGGDRRGDDGDDTTGSGLLGEGGATGILPTASPRGSNLDPDIQPLFLSQAEQDALVAFLLSLTDDRVACEQAPFDHPELTLANGQRPIDANKDGHADDNLIKKQAVGAGGLPAEGKPCIPNTGNLFDMQRLFQP